MISGGRVGRDGQRFDVFPTCLRPSIRHNTYKDEGTPSSIQKSRSLFPVHDRICEIEVLVRTKSLPLALPSLLWPLARGHGSNPNTQKCCMKSRASRFSHTSFRPQ